MTGQKSPAQVLAGLGIEMSPEDLARVKAETERLNGAVKPGPVTAANGSEYRVTTLHWYVADNGAKVACYYGRYKNIPYGSALTKEFIADDRPPHPRYGGFQVTGIACAPQLYTIIIDGDHPELWADTPIGRLLGDWREVATSIREFTEDGVTRYKFHILVEVPPHLATADWWPRQLEFPAGGDDVPKCGHIKSNGFAYVEGWCKDGSRYVPTGKRHLVADEDVMRAFLASNGGMLDEDGGAASDDDYDEWAAALTDPDGDYMPEFADQVLGNWGAEGSRNGSLPRRCGIIKAAGEQGRAGMATLFRELCTEYDCETGRGDSDVYRAFARCHEAHGKVGQITQNAMMPAEWSREIDARYAAAVAAGPVPVPSANGNHPPGKETASIEAVSFLTETPAGATPAGATPAPGDAQGSAVAQAAPFVFDPRAGSDQGLGDACLHAVQPQYRYAADVQAWLSAGPEKWEMHSADLCSAIVSQLADYMPEGITAQKASDNGLKDDDPAVKAALAQSARRERLRSAAGAGAIASKMRSRVAIPGKHRMALRLADLDADPGIIWAGGIPWDIRQSRTGLAVAAADRETPHLKSCRYAPEDVPTPLWDAFCAAMWPIAEIRDWALRLLALGVTGYAEKAFPLLSGVTDTGKTSIAEAVADVLGDYAVTVSPELLTGGTGSSMDYARFELKGARLAFLDEAPRTGKLAQEALKNLTGGGGLHGRPPYGKPVSFRASHTIMATANPESDPPMTDDAVRGRIRLIPCAGNVAAVRAARNALFPLDGEPWQKEAPGVLAALIMRAAEVMADPGLVRNDRAPEVVQYWGAYMAAQQDTVAGWYAAETEPPDQYMQETRNSELHDDYVAWCRRKDAKPVDKIIFGRRLVKLGCPRRESNGVTWYTRKLRTPGYGAYR